ncbi:proteasome component Pre1 [Drepanopeziza brunnea f. sp. 'multigermtubi' MB_m1]|uniref:Proteasome subunit beta n=1 Tax=Marssonina brunnea f. sp. multigermtubi (strain MB_m1) TaxID=1072389 RepID=K1X693_MARBU|nr:proteasome component Pre1 [Drepanopeziza brunnea f. sp. 'multigermtubi' MB_m1]EKD16133.1 proteasome component Pre1 [Drepanopeziza brunnea f. sp. 'multigermtubi' MB_m1]
MTRYQVIDVKENTTLEVLLGITGKDFTLIACSKAAMRGATVLKASDDKTRELNKHTLMAFSGEAGDTIQFAEYIQANAQLYSMRNSTSLTPTALAHFVRGELASSLRSRKPYNVNLLLGGVDPLTNRPSLYWLDYLASLAPLPYAAHGYAQYYCLSILDKHHHPDIGYEEGIKLLRLCTDELKRRLPIDFKGMMVKVVTKDGVREVDYDDEARIACP